MNLQEAISYYEENKLHGEVAFNIEGMSPYVVGLIRNEKEQIVPILNPLCEKWKVAGDFPDVPEGSHPAYIEIGKHGPVIVYWFKNPHPDT